MEATPMVKERYRGYWIAVTPSRVWVECDNALICWAKDAVEARTKIDELLGSDGR
jgi:hypothetical protein